MVKVLEVRPMVGDGSSEAGKLVARKSFEVWLSDRGELKKFEIQIGLGVLETKDPRECVEKYFKEQQCLPENGVLDITPPR
jgi:hypothetical protein